MIVNETAKFEKPDMRRTSSWAYPSLCRVSSSDGTTAEGA